MSRTTRPRSRTFVLLAAVAAVIPFLTAPTAAAAAYPVGPFDATYGNTYTRGQVTFYNRSVLVEGEHKAVGSSGCRYTRARTFTASGQELSTARSLSTVCTISLDFSFTVSADVVGGADRVVVSLIHSETGQVLTNDVVWRR